MKRYALLLCISAIAYTAVCFAPAVASEHTVSARVASLDIPVPTFDDVHLAYMRIVANESGFKSLADQDGILRSLLYRGGGRRSGRRQRGQGYGLDYAKLMRRMAQHSKRTFPVDSRFLLLTDRQRLRFGRSQTRHNRWTSTIKLDCSEPDEWPDRKPDGSPMVSWRYGYGKRCKLLVRTTRAFLRGKMRGYCDGQPTTWGSRADMHRPGGALDEEWSEIHCDRPPDTPATCGMLHRQELLNSTTCARNTFWTWNTKDKETTDGRRTRTVRREI